MPSSTTATANAITTTTAIASRGDRNIPEWYFDLTTEYQAIYGEKVVVFLQVGQFFEIYGVRNSSGSGSGSGYLFSRIEEVASLCNLNIANKNSSFKDMPMVMAGFKPMYLDRYVPRLHEAGYTIPIYIETHEYADGSKHRELDSILSPGTSFTSDTSVVSNNVACIVLHYVAGNRWIGEKKIISGFAVVDVLSGDFVVDEFHTDYATHDPGVFDDLERVCSIYQPSELIVIYKSAGDTILNSERVNEILRFAGVHAGISVRLVDTAEPGNFSTKALNAEKQTYQKLAFERFFTIYDYGSFEHSTGFTENPVAATAACFLLDYVHSHNSHLTEKIQEPIMNPASTHLRLANHSLRQLHIIEDDQGRNMGKARSVQTLLNNTDTAMGGRLFKQFLLNPIISSEELNRRYDTISRALESYDALLGVRNHLRNIKDIERMYRRIVLEKTTPDDIFSLHSSLTNIAAVLTELTGEAGETGEAREAVPFVEAIEALNKNGTIVKWNSTATHLIGRIEDCLDLDTCSGVTAQKPDVNVFRRGIYADVDAIHKKSLDAVDIVNAVVRQLSDSTATALNGGGTSTSSETEYFKIHMNTPLESSAYLTIVTLESKGIEGDLSNNNSTILNDSNCFVPGTADFKNGSFIVGVKCSGGTNNLVLNILVFDLYKGE
jgi:DNA mismatch repair ATPase MutS